MRRTTCIGPMGSRRRAGRRRKVAALHRSSRLRPPPPQRRCLHPLGRRELREDVLQMVHQRRCRAGEPRCLLLVASLILQRLRLEGLHRGGLSGDLLFFLLLLRLQFRKLVRVGAHIEHQSVHVVGHLLVTHHRVERVQECLALQQRVDCSAVGSEHVPRYDQRAQAGAVRLQCCLRRLREPGCFRELRVGRGQLNLLSVQLCLRGGGLLPSLYGLRLERRGLHLQRHDLLLQCLRLRFQVHDLRTWRGRRARARAAAGSRCRIGPCRHPGERGQSAQHNRTEVGRTGINEQAWCS